MELNPVITDLVRKAKTAAKQIENYTQRQIDEVCLAIGWEVYKDENIEQLARLAVEESGMGVYEDKLKKHKGKVMGVLCDVINPGAKSVGVIERDAEKGITKYAKPVGVVGALCPVTNPTATPASNAVSILKGRNAVIFAPHPRSKKASALAVQFMRNGLKKVGAPEDLIQVIAEPSVELSSQLMSAVDVVVATGGGAMVKAAYSSGTPSYGVGPCNACSIIAEDADVADVAAKVFMSKTFDNATSCSSDNSLVIHNSVYDKLIAALVKLGAYMVNDTERAALKDHMWKPDKSGHMALNPKIVCQSAVTIAAGAGIKLPDSVKMIIAAGESAIEEDPFAREKLSPVLTVYRYETFDEALSILIRLTNNCGTGHSCGIHTFNREYIDTLGITMRSSRILVRQAQAQGNGGAFFNGMPSTVTLGCGSWGGNSTTENINYRHFLNITWLSEPVDRKKPDDDEMWGSFFKKYGK
jgi:sulfoacetaldehyde dehydrogenase